MNSLRESLASIPGTLASLSSTISYHSTSTASSAAGESESTDENSICSTKSQAIPNTLIKEQWQLILNSDASIPDLENAILRCKELVLNSDECSNERKWLVRHLVELRLTLRELQSSMDDPFEEASPTKSVLGHHFHLRQNTSTLPISLPLSLPARISACSSSLNDQYYCDHCTGIIWTMLQASFQCSDCNFVVHQKCLEKVTRICAHVIVSENNFPIVNVCPEIGLAAQSYKCNECQSSLIFKGSWIEPRLCDYNGFYYCQTCHWSDTSVIPSRIIHNWDFRTYKVCRASLQQINLLMEKPVINLEDINPKLFVFLQKLSTIRKLREDLVIMKKYLTECRNAIKTKFLDQQIGTRRHLVQNVDFYNIVDLMQAESGVLIDFLNKIYNDFDRHIRECDVCSGKGYICEICSNNEIIYPYEDGSIPCEKCNSIYHRVCWTKKNMNCAKCKRIEKRSTVSDGNEADEEIEDISEKN